MKTHFKLQNLNEICEQSSKTKAAIAREMGISPQQLNNIIHLHRPIPLRLIAPFCKAVGCDPNYLFGWENRRRGG